MRLSFNALYICRFWQVKKESAQTEPAWKGAGQKPGIEIWRIKKFKVIESTQSHYLSSLTWGVLRTKILGLPKVAFWLVSSTNHTIYGVCSGCSRSSKEWALRQILCFGFGKREMNIRSVLRLLPARIYEIFQVFRGETCPTVLHVLRGLILELREQSSMKRISNLLHLKGANCIPHMGHTMPEALAYHLWKIPRAQLKVSNA